jgi:hypothetical protein
MGVGNTGYANKLASNMADVTLYIPPTAPKLSPNPITPTTGTVTVTINYSADSITKKYAIDYGPWTNYTSPVIMSSNGIIYAKGINSKGMGSMISSLPITNILTQQTSSIDFNTADEANYIQQDAANGTDFANGIVVLHGSNSGSGTIDISAGSGEDGISYQQCTTLEKINFNKNTNITSIEWKENLNYGAPANVKAVIYRCSDGVKLAQSGTYSVSYPSWQTFPITASLSANVDYAIGICGPYIGITNGSPNGTYTSGSVSATVTNIGWAGGDVYVNPSSTLYALKLKINYYGSASYPTSQGYYVTTGTGSRLDTSTWNSMSGVALTQTEPANTQVRYLVSFDGRNTWKRWTGSAWVEETLANIHTNGMTKTALEGITQVQWNSAGFVPGTLDFAVGLKTTDANVTPSIDKIQEVV